MRKRKKRVAVKTTAAADISHKGFRGHCAKALLVTASYQLFSLSAAQTMAWTPARRPDEEQTASVQEALLLAMPAAFQVPPVNECRCVGGCTGCTGISTPRRQSSSGQSRSTTQVIPEAQVFNQANALARAGRWSEAEPLYRHALEINPKFAIGYYGLAICLYHLDKDYEALEEAEKALRHGLSGDLKKQCREWMQELREYIQKQEAKQKEQEAKQKIFELAKQAFDEGSRLLDQGRNKEAEAAYRRAYGYDVDSPTANNLGLALYRQGKLQEAEEFYRKAISLNANSVNANGNLGLLLLDLGRNADAIVFLRHAVQLGANAAIKIDLGICLVRLARASGPDTPDRAALFAEAEPLIRFAMSNDPNDALYRANIGEILLNKTSNLAHKNDYSGAEAAAREFVELSPTSAIAHESLGSALMNLGQLKEAEAQFREALRIDPNGKDAQANLNELTAKQAQAASNASGTAPSSSTQISSTPAPSEAASGNPPGALAPSGQRAVDQALSNFNSTTDGLGSNIKENTAAGSRPVFDTAGMPAEAPVNTASVQGGGRWGAVQSLVSRIPPEAKRDPAVQTSVAWFARREVDRAATQTQLATVQADIDGKKGDPVVLAVKQKQLSIELKRIDGDQQAAKSAIQQRMVALNVGWVEESPEANPEERSK